MSRIGRLLEEDGSLSVSLDLPEHGDQSVSSASGLPGWAIRVGRGDNPIEEFVDRVGDVLDYLGAEGYTDPDVVVVAGNSRGGFAALHYAATDPRVGFVVLFAPVTNLAVLQEFEGLEDDPPWSPQCQRYGSQASSQIATCGAP